MATEVTGQRVFDRDAIEATLDWNNHKRFDVLIDGNLLIKVAVYEDGQAEVTVFKSTHPDAEQAWCGLVNVAERGAEDDNDKAPPGTPYGIHGHRPSVPQEAGLDPWCECGYRWDRQPDSLLVGEHIAAEAARLGVPIDVPGWLV